MSKSVLVIDVGTQSTRAIIFDENGRILEKEKISYEPYFSVYPGYAEQNPNVYWETMCQCCRRIADRNQDILLAVEGVTVATIRDTLVFIDDKGDIVRPSMIWLDQRMSKERDGLTRIDELKFAVAGMKKAAIISKRKSKCNWIKENEKENWERINKVLLLTGYFHYRFTGKFIDSVASQVGHIPFDYKRHKWIKSDTHYKYSLFGIERSMLPELVDSGTIIGNVTKDISEETCIPEGVPIVVSGTDKGCETVGVGCNSLDTVSLSFGTTATIQTTSHKYFEPIKFMPAYPSLMKDHYNPEVEIFRGFWMISWFKKEFAQREIVEAMESGVPPEKLLNERLDEIPPGSLGLILQPYWGPGLKTPEAKGAIIGFGDVHTRSHIYRSIIEGINFALMDGAEAIMQKSKVNIEKVMVSGGGSQSDSICQITADMFNRTVYKGETYEACGLGAAICVYVSLGVYGDYQEASEHMVRYSKVFHPEKKNADIYNKLYWRVYKNVYPKLKGIYRDIQEITGYPEIYFDDEKARDFNEKEK